MKKNISFVLILFLLPFISFSQENIDSLEMEKMERILHANDTTESKTDWEFMLRVSRKKLAKKFFWMDKNNFIRARAL